MSVLHRHLDFINLMTYDFHGAWRQTTGHHSPLFRAREATGTDRFSNAVSSRRGGLATKEQGVSGQARGVRGCESRSLVQTCHPCLGPQGSVRMRLWDEAPGRGGRPRDLRTWALHPQDYAVGYVLRLGAPAGKLVMGIPTYGRTFTLASSETGVGAPISGPGTAGRFTKEEGILAYYEVRLGEKARLPLRPASLPWGHERCGGPGGGRPGTASHGPSCQSPAAVRQGSRPARQGACLSVRPGPALSVPHTALGRADMRAGSPWCRGSRGLKGPGGTQEAGSQHRPLPPCPRLCSDLRLPPRSHSPQTPRPAGPLRHQGQPVGGVQRPAERQEQGGSPKATLGRRRRGGPGSSSRPQVPGVRRRVPRALSPPWGPSPALRSPLQVQYLRSSQLAGAMVWALDLDDFRGTFCGQNLPFPLTSAIKDALTAA